MNRFSLLLILLAGYFSCFGENVDEILESLSTPGFMSARVDITSPSRAESWEILTIPHGDFLIEGPEKGEFLAGCGGELLKYRQGNLTRDMISAAAFSPSVQWLPSVMASTLRKQLADTAAYRVISPEKGVITVESLRGGLPYLETRYVFSTGSHMPVSVTRTSVSKGTELQSAAYTPLVIQTPDSISESYLRGRFPDAFIPRLPHTHFKTLFGERRFDMRSEVNDSLVAVIDAASPGCIDKMTDVRERAAGRPVVWAFVNTNVEDILLVYPETVRGETALYGAGRLPLNTLYEVKNQEIISQSCLH